jgi:hypothetical protein
MGPLPIGRASVIHASAGRSDHKHNFLDAPARAGFSGASAAMSVRGLKPSAAVAREAENKKRRREMAFSVVLDLVVIPATHHQNLIYQICPSLVNACEEKEDR